MSALGGPQQGSGSSTKGGEQFCVRLRRSAARGLLP